MDRRKAGDDAYRAKFDESGLSDYFEFIGRDWNSDHGKKVTVRCKACGSVFTGWGPSQYFKNKQGRVLCPECGYSFGGGSVWTRTNEADEVAAYYVAGHSVAETAKRFGVPKHQVNNLAKTRRLTNGRNWREAAEDSNRRRHEDAVSRRDAIKAAKEVKKQKKAAERKAQEEERKQKARQEAAVRAWERKWYRLTHPRKTGYEVTHDAFLDRTGTCKICGKPYVVRDYVKACGLKMARDSGVCSPKCRDENNRRNRRRSHIGRQDSHRHRAKRFGSAYDPTISLKKLVDRDGLKCAICGGMCDWNDRSWSEYFGPTYPSIDHIIPMSKGGPHTWDNVQVAHIICNSYKGDSTEEGLEYDAG